MATEPARGALDTWFRETICFLDSAVFWDKRKLSRLDFNGSTAADKRNYMKWPVKYALLNIPWTTGTEHTVA
jgi:hypothetical protein